MSVRGNGGTDLAEAGRRCPLFPFFQNPDDLTETKGTPEETKDSLEEEQGEMIPSSVSDGGGVSSSKDFVWPSDSLIAEHWTEKPEMGPDGEPETASSSHAGIREQSFRSGNIRGHPSDTSAFLESVAETSHLRKKGWCRSMPEKSE